MGEKKYIEIKKKSKQCEGKHLTGRNGLKKDLLLIKGMDRNVFNPRDWKGRHKFEETITRQRWKDNTNIHDTNGSVLIPATGCNKITLYSQRGVTNVLRVLKWFPPSGLVDEHLQLVNGISRYSQCSTSNSLSTSHGSGKFFQGLKFSRKLTN